MAKDDMAVAMYRILCYLYACMRKGIEPDEGEYDHVALGICERYWNDIVRELFRDRLVTGLMVIPHGDDARIVLQRPRPTLAGVQFMEENSAMARARDFLVAAKAVVPGL